MRARGNYPFLTLKERDIETGLDFFEARYYSSTQGRFTSVDPEGGGANPDDAQSWNGYAYARSNPVGPPMR
jgi:RHS repeat-associated protein